MRIEHNALFSENAREIICTDFQAIEQDNRVLHIYLSGGFTMDIGVEEWKRLMALYEHRYQNKE